MGNVASGYHRDVITARTLVNSTVSLGASVASLASWGQPAHPHAVDADWELRLAAFDHLTRLRDRSGGLVALADLEAGFELRGERIPLFNRYRGIWRPRQLGAEGPALSITTTPPRLGKTPPYDDQVASQEG